MPSADLRRRTDAELVVLVAGGDRHAFEVIYDRHRTPVFGLAMYVTQRRRGAEEVTQDAFLTLWRRAAGYDVSRGTARTWLLSIARHRAIDWLRREERHVHLVELGEAGAEHLEADERTDEQVVALDTSRRVRGILGALPDEQREVIELSYFKGLTQAEIAARVGIPLGTVKGRQRLALSKLLRLMRSDDAPRVSAAAAA